MANIVLNLTEENLSSNFELAAPGIYKVEIEEAEFGKSQAGNDKIGLVLKSLEESYKGKFFANVTLTAKAAPFGLIPLLKALGHEVSAGQLEVPGEDELIGKEVAVKVTKAFSYKDDNDKWVKVKESEVEALEADGIDVKKRNEVDGRTYAPIGGKAKAGGASKKKFSLN